MKMPSGFPLGRTSLLALAVALSGQVSAQEKAEATTQSTAGVLEEVSVTAQRRTERSLDVPIAITALSADQLGQGDVQQLGDIMKLTPGLRFDNLGGNAQPTIRGVGTAVVVAGAGSNVALYTDGFYSPNPLMADSELLNIESVQVLKGPQGTLFGRNSTGGAILVTTKEPSSEESVALNASYGSYNAQRYQMYATGGVSETLAFDVAGMMRKGDGYLDNIITGSDKDGAYDNWAVRTGMRWEASDTTSVVLRYSHAETDDPTAIAVNFYEEGGVPRSTAANAFSATVASDPYDVSNGYKPKFTSESDAVQLTVKVDLDFAALTSYTQYRDETGTHYYDFDGSGENLYHYIFETTDEIFTQEFLLSSTNDSRLQWTTGLFLFVNETEYPNNLASSFGSPFAKTGGSGVESSSVALFGDMTYALRDDLFLTLGLRYSRDEITEAYYNDDVLGKIDIPDYDDDHLSPRIALRYEMTENSSVYGSFSKGFKSGILNVAGETLDGIEVDPEEIKAYEVGYKYHAGNLMLDLSAFYYDYEGLQVASYVGTQSFIKNAASSSVYGAEAQTRYAITDQLEVSLGVAYLDAEYDDFAESQVWTEIGGFYSPGFADASGNDMQRSPEITATLGMNYQTEVAGGSLNLSGNLYHTSDFYFDSSENYKQDGYELLSLRAEWTDPSDQYTVAVYGDNLTDEEYRSQVLPQFYGALSTWGAPRTFGVSVGYRFN